MKTQLKQIAKIDKKRWYKPREIAELGLITNSKGKGDYWRVLKLIKQGKLTYTNYSTAAEERGTQEYKMVLGQSIVEYLAKYEI